MTIRSVIIGILLGVGISIFTYFNDHIIQQTFLIGNHFPVAVFAPVLIILLAVNPLLNALRFRIFRPMEIAIITALGLAVCGWPGSSFFRAFSSLITTPATMAKSETGWKANQVMSYLPGVSALLGEGHVTDWPELAGTLSAASKDSSPSPTRRIWDLLPERTRAGVLAIASTGKAEQAEKADIVNSLNDILSMPDFYTLESFRSVTLSGELGAQVASIRSFSEHQRHRVNRALLNKVFPAAIMQPTRGEGFFLADGDVQAPAFQGLMQGASQKKIALADVPWQAWWPVLRFWGSLAILLGLAAVCLSVIVFPQWRRELLAFPIARFVHDISQPAGKGGLPAVARSKLFWYGFALVWIIHIVNGLKVWFPESILIPLNYIGWPLAKLFPNANQFQWAYHVFNPLIIPTLVAFAYFLRSEVSFSVGVSGALFLVVFGGAKAAGLPFSNDFIEAKQGNMLRFGAYLSSAAMMFFVGRHYYTRVLASCFKIGRNDEVPGSAVWATRILALCCAGLIWVLTQNGLDFLLSAALIGSMLLMFLIMTRINAETGAFFLQPMWVPVGILAAFLGSQAVGPTAYIIMAVVSTVFVADPREAVMPFVANGLYMATPGERRSPHARSILLIGGMVVVGFAIALAATLYFQYSNGLNSWDHWVTRYLPKYAYDAASTNISELAAYNELTSSLTIRNFQRFQFMSMKPDVLGWGILGIVLVAATSILRLLFAWWPLHPVCFLVWGTMPGMMVAWSFLLGWMIKTAVVKMSGVKGYGMIKPFMIGMIGGEMMAALTWTIVGTIYYFTTGLVPTSYKVFGHLAG